MKASILLLMILGMIAINVVTGGPIEDPKQEASSENIDKNATISDIDVHSRRKRSKDASYELTQSSVRDCSDVGKMALRDEGECKNAASELSISYAGGGSLGDHNPKGCFYWSSHVFWNTHQTGSNRPDSKAICRKYGQVYYTETVGACQNGTISDNFYDSDCRDRCSDEPTCSGYMNSPYGTSCETFSSPRVTGNGWSDYKCYKKIDAVCEDKYTYCKEVAHLCSSDSAWRAGCSRTCDDCGDTQPAKTIVPDCFKWNGKLWNGTTPLQPVPTVCGLPTCILCTEPVVSKPIHPDKVICNDNLSTSNVQEIAANRKSECKDCGTSKSKCDSSQCILDEGWIWNSCVARNG